MTLNNLISNMYVQICKTPADMKLKAYVILYRNKKYRGKHCLQTKITGE